MSKRKQKALLLLSGQPQIYAITAISFYFVFTYIGYSPEFTSTIILLASTIRFLFYLTRAPKPVLEEYSIRKRFKRLIEDEGKTLLTLTAVSFLANLPLLPSDLIWAIAINLIGQTAGLFLSNQILTFLKVNRYCTGQKNVLIIGTGKNAKKACDAVLDSPESESTLAGFLDYKKKSLWRYRDIPLIGHPDELAGIISHTQIDLIIVAAENGDISKTDAVFEIAEKMGIAICYAPDLYHPTISKARPAFINSMPVMLYRAVPDDQLKLFVKQVIDRIGALIGIIVFSPVMFGIALAIKIEDGGDILFKQIRSGLNGRQFHLFKFRTMCSDAEAKKAELAEMNEMSGPVFKITNDPRVTKVGRFLRKTSLDELPQFFNVLVGNMSLVGPRPPLPKEVAEYKHWQHRRLSVKPGVTCTWQVSGRNNIDFEDWMKLDLDYIDNWSLWNDTKIILKTVPAVLKGSGAS